MFCPLAGAMDMAKLGRGGGRQPNMNMRQIASMFNPQMLQKMGGNETLAHTGVLEMRSETSHGMSPVLCYAGMCWDVLGSCVAMGRDGNGRGGSGRVGTGRDGMAWDANMNDMRCDVM